jgi:hypothetical protein
MCHEFLDGLNSERGRGEIGVGAGEVEGQALSLGLIDQVAIDIAPPLLHEESGRKFAG